MVIDTSALIAILTDEAERASFIAKIGADPVRLMSAASLVEASLVMDSRRGEAGGHEIDLFLHRAAIEIVAVDLDQCAIARRALRLYGRGRHAARLNYGDLFAYALAKTTGEPLLFKGTNFALTDIAAA